MDPTPLKLRRADKTDIPGTFSVRGGSAFGGNANGATLGPINETNMARIWNKHKQIHPVRNGTFSNGAGTPLKPHTSSLRGRRKVFVGMSGGVDSSVTAALLSAKGGSASGGKERGFDVTGVHIKMWSDPEIPCNFKRDREDAIRVAAHLGISFETWDFTKEYREEVVDYMIREYREGRTPNPDVMCNRHIKFGVFLEKALERGADWVATGHYVRAVPSSFYFRDTLVRSSGGLAKGRRDFSSFDETKQIAPPIVARSKMPRPPGEGIQKFKLLKGVDKNKDQSYFLWTLTQEELRHCLFPIGEYTKPEVRRLARKFGLPTAEKEESQGICFIGEINLNQFLKKYIPVSHGRVLTTSGKDIGEHEGLPFYTMGQREGLRIGGGIPYYVAAKDFSTNTLVVAEGPYDKGLFKSEIAVSDVHWISGRAPELPLVCEARIRYRQPLQSCRIERIPSNTERINTNHELFAIRVNSSLNPCSIRVRFEEPQRAVTPGQSIVFYSEEEMIGGGIIG